MKTEKKPYIFKYKRKENEIVAFLINLKKQID